MSCCVTHHHTSTRAHIAYRCSQHSMRHEMLPPREGLQPQMRGGGGGGHTELDCGVLILSLTR